MRQAASWAVGHVRLANKDETMQSHATDKGSTRAFAAAMSPKNRSRFFHLQPVFLAVLVCGVMLAGAFVVRIHHAISVVTLI
jgi:hypothetical protein